MQEHGELKTGVFCQHVDDYILSPICPLASGSCMWQHRAGPKCTYSKDFANSTFTVQEFCDLVGIKAPSADAVNNLREKMIKEVRRSLTE